MYEQNRIEINQKLFILLLGMLLVVSPLLDKTAVSTPMPSFFPLPSTQTLLLDTQVTEPIESWYAQTQFILNASWQIAFERGDGEEKRPFFPFKNHSQPIPKIAP